METGKSPPQSGHSKTAAKSVSSGSANSNMIHLPPSSIVMRPGVEISMGVTSVSRKSDVSLMMRAGLISMMRFNALVSFFIGLVGAIDPV